MKFAASAFTNSQQFVPTMLMGSSPNTTMNANMSLSDVTGGQVVGGTRVGDRVVVHRAHCRINPHLRTSQ